MGAMTVRRAMPLEQQAKAHEVGRRVALARDRTGYTQVTLAAKLGVTPGAVAQWETGRSLPKPMNAQRIARELNVSVEWLWQGADVGGRVEAVTTAERDAIAALREMPPDIQEVAVAQLRALAHGRAKKT